MKRVLLFLATNLAVLVVLGTVLRLVGFEGFLDEQGVGLDLRQLLLFAAVFGVGGSFVSLAMSKWIARRATGARVIAEPATPTEAWLIERVRAHARATGIGMPDVAVYDAAAPNAFATGARRNHALVAVSTGLLATMGREEADAVLAHEVSHVANGDMITLALIQGVVNTFVIFVSRVVGHVVDRVVFRTEEGHGPGFWITAIACELVFAVLASIVVLWFSRRREFRADAGGARLVGAGAMIGALERLRDHAGTPLPDGLRAFGISGGGRRGWAALFASHPPLEQRIERLRRLEA